MVDGRGLGCSYRIGAANVTLRRHSVLRRMFTERVAGYSRRYLGAPGRYRPPQTGLNVLTSPRRAQHAAEWPAQAAYEGPVRGAVSHGACAAELAPALPAHAHGPPGVGAYRLSDVGQPRPADAGAVRGQPAARLPVRPHPAGARRAHAGECASLCRQQRVPWAPGPTSFPGTPCGPFQRQARCPALALCCATNGAFAWLCEASGLRSDVEKHHECRADTCFAALLPFQRALTVSRSHELDGLGRQALTWLPLFPGRCALFLGVPELHSAEVHPCCRERAVWPPPEETEEKGRFEPVLGFVVIRALCWVWGCPLVFC